MHAETHRAFVVEADRATEPGRTSDDQRKSLRKNVRQYRDFIGEKLYKQAYGLNAGLVVLTVFSSPARQKTFLEIVEEEIAQATYLCAKSAQEFSSPFKPGDVVRHLYQEPWPRQGHEPLNIMQA